MYKHTRAHAPVNTNTCTRTHMTLQYLKTRHVLARGNGFVMAACEAQGHSVPECFWATLLLCHKYLEADHQCLGTRAM